MTQSWHDKIYYIIMSLPEGIFALLTQVDALDQGTHPHLPLSYLNLREDIAWAKGSLF